MPRSSHRAPKYRHYRPKDLAVVRIDGKDHYLGKYDSPESWEKYHRLVADFLGKLRHAANGHEPDLGDEHRLSINEVLLAYIRFADGYYAKDGQPTKELACMKEALRPARHLYGHTPAADFGPKALKTVRRYMIDQQELSRGVINHRVSRIKRVFKWAVAEELVPPSVYHGLQAVTGLRYGRTEARETEPVKPVPEQHVDAVLPFVAPQIAAMIQVQRLTGMRPCEVVQMRACDIDMSGSVWIYEAADHKNRWRGHQKIVPLGPKAQEVLKAFLKRPADQYLFNPQEAEEWRRENRPVHTKAERKTPIYPSELKAREKAKEARRNRKPKRQKHERYSTDTYRKAIEYGFKKAAKAGVEIPHWHPNQLRHNRGTEVRKKYGIEAAQVALGHARADVTEVYAEKNLELAMRIAREMG